MLGQVIYKEKQSNTPFQIISHFSFVLSQLSLTLTKCLEKYINIYNIK